MRFENEVNMGSAGKEKDYNIAIKLSGWGSLLCLGIFFLNIIIGKIMHITKVSVDSPISGPAEFLLLGSVILQFTVCVLLKEATKETGAK